MGDARIIAVWGRAKGIGASNRALCPYHLATWVPVGEGRCSCPPPAIAAHGS